MDRSEGWLSQSVTKCEDNVRLPLVAKHTKASATKTRSKPLQVGLGGSPGGD